MRIMLISAPGGRFPIERRRVRFALISAFFAEIKAAFHILLATLRLCSQKPFFVTAFAGVAAFASINGASNYL
ncbi:hypothetical protein [Sporosarcina sp. ACRSL]|uniref:hypothetical protein n=1 Tax=Sporosarcina sp. ACRSL TaxID=2918215 RepID=UPI001EF5BC82|nr:hypothetical protein [Sporosarcina sp. ACRSL]